MTGKQEANKMGAPVVEDEVLEEEERAVVTLAELTAGLDARDPYNVRVKNMPSAAEMAAAIMQRLRLLDMWHEQIGETLEDLQFDWDWSLDDDSVKQSTGVIAMEKAGELVDELRGSLFKWLCCCGRSRLIELDETTMSTIAKIGDETMPLYRRHDVAAVVRGCAQFVSSDPDAMAAVAKLEEDRSQKSDAECRRLAAQIRGNTGTDLDDEPEPPAEPDPVSEAEPEPKATSKPEGMVAVTITFSEYDEQPEDVRDLVVFSSQYEVLRRELRGLVARFATAHADTLRDLLEPKIPGAAKSNHLAGVASQTGDDSENTAPSNHGQTEPEVAESVPDIDALPMSVQLYCEVDSDVGFDLDIPTIVADCDRGRIRRELAELAARFSSRYHNQQLGYSVAVIPTGDAGTESNPEDEETHDEETPDDA